MSEPFLGEIRAFAFPFPMRGWRCVMDPFCKLPSTRRCIRSSERLMGGTASRPLPCLTCGGECLSTPETESRSDRLAARKRMC